MGTRNWLKDFHRLLQNCFWSHQHVCNGFSWIHIWVQASGRSACNPWRTFWWPTWSSLICLILVMIIQKINKLTVIGLTCTWWNMNWATVVPNGFQVCNWYIEDCVPRVSYRILSLGEAPPEEFWFTRFEADVEATLPRFGRMEMGGLSKVSLITGLRWTGLEWTELMKTSEIS